MFVCCFVVCSCFVVLCYVLFCYTVLFVAVCCCLLLFVVAIIVVMCLVSLVLAPEGGQPSEQVPRYHAPENGHISKGES